MVVFYKTIVEYHNQDINIDMVKIQNISIISKNRESLKLPFIDIPILLLIPPPPSLLATTDL